MRIFFTGGGTGGHVYPGLAVAEALTSLCAEVGLPLALLWVGAEEGIEADLVRRHGILFQAVTAGALRGTNPVGLARGMWRLRRGIAEAGDLLERARPDAMMATGGYASVPLMLAGHRRGVPSLLYLPDMQPGWAVRFLARWADEVAVSFQSVAAYFGDKALVTGYPVRRALLDGASFAARQKLGLDGSPTLLVFGGSLGARSINRAVRDHLPALLEAAQVVHVCGNRDFEAMRGVCERLTPEQREWYHLYAYLHEEMTDALLAADLAVARAGAGTLGEFPAVGLPSVLVPYPHAGPNQGVNAAYLAERGAAVVIDDQEIAQRLGPVVCELLADADRREGMAMAASRLSVPDAARTIARELLRLAGAREEGLWSP